MGNYEYCLPPDAAKILSILARQLSFSQHSVTNASWVSSPGPTLLWASPG